jgi:acyl-coenzyme A thioesterase PaaI-like protein
MPFAPAYENVHAELVHKQSAEGVLLGGWRSTGARSHRVVARWSRVHDGYLGPDGRPDPMLYIETVRQCLPLLSHVAFDVPLENHLVWESFSCAIATDSADAGRLLDEAEIDVSCEEVRARGTRVTALALSFTVRHGDTVLATAHTRFTIQTPPVYQRLRGERTQTSSADSQHVVPPPVPARAVGRLMTSEVLVSATNRPRTWHLRVDTLHPVYFDHPVDHVPGALLLGAAFQAAYAAVHEAGQPLHQFLPVEINGRFIHFVELGDPCEVTARPTAEADAAPGRKQVEVTFQQQGARPDAEPSFSAVVTLSRRKVPGQRRASTRTTHP